MKPPKNPDTSADRDDTPDPPLVRVRILIHRTSYHGVIFAKDSIQTLPKPDADTLVSTGHVEIIGL